MSTWLEGAVGAIDGTAVGTLLVRLGCAALLGAFVAYRPWRRLLGRGEALRLETSQAQTLIAVAGALMVGVIGDSMARAFGLVGLGAFIRFRSGIKDPRDAAVMFVMIGVGMACGLGLVSIAAAATLFASAVLALFDRAGRASPRRTRVVVELEQPAAALAALRRVFPTGRILALPGAGAARGKVTLEVEADATADAARTSERLAAEGLAVHQLAFDED